MISDRKLMKLCLAMSFIGIIVLFFVVQSIEPRQASIAEINNDMVGELVAVSGVAGNVYNSEDTLFFDLSDNGGKIKVVMFQSSTEISQGNAVTVTGKVSLYKNELEIVASSIQANL